MNVKVVMFPQGEDPDSYSKKLSQEDFTNYLSENTKDFIQYKSELLNKNSQNDPAKRVKYIKDIYAFNFFYSRQTIKIRIL